MIHVRTKPKVVVNMPSPYNFVRQAVDLDLIVVHSTEGHNRPGIEDLQSLGGWFQKNPHKVASHVGNDAEGQSARFVGDARKCYHAGLVNSASLGIEQIGFASQKTWPEQQIAETARWCALWSIQYGIPLQKGSVDAQGKVVRAGIVQHADLSITGSDHWDCGPNYPFRLLLELSREFKERQQHPQFVRALRKGDEHRAVKTFQAQMKDRGRSIAVDGIFGPATLAVVKAFQKEAKIKADGVIDSETWNAAWEYPIAR